jgi:hypothetical protein
LREAGDLANCLARMLGLDDGEDLAQMTRWRVEAHEFRLINALITAGRLTESEALRRRCRAHRRQGTVILRPLVEKAGARLLQDFALTEGGGTTRRRVAFSNPRPNNGRPSPFVGSDGPELDRCNAGWSGAT